MTCTFQQEMQQNIIEYKLNMLFMSGRWINLLDTSYFHSISCFSEIFPPSLESWGFE